MLSSLASVCVCVCVCVCVGVIVLPEQIQGCLCQAQEYCGSLLCFLPLSVCPVYCSNNDRDYCTSVCLPVFMRFFHFVCCFSNQKNEKMILYSSMFECCGIQKPYEPLWYSHKISCQCQHGNSFHTCGRVEVVLLFAWV